MTKTGTSEIRKRLSNADRRSAIIDAAAVVFAEGGLSGATTRAIAHQAGVSEALLYRHFVSKEALYFAVLRRLLRAQNEQMRRTLDVPPGETSLVQILRNYFTGIVHLHEHVDNVVAHQVLMKSLAGDGRYARLLYKRSFRLYRPILERIVGQWTESGLINDCGIDLDNIHFFIDHVGLMMAMGLLSEPKIFNYANGGDDLIDQAVLFCARGIGLPEHLIKQVPVSGNAEAA